MNDCPNCSAGWRATELTGQAHHGGGYHIACHICGHEWDDPTASHGARQDARQEMTRYPMSDIEKDAAAAKYLEIRHDAQMKGWRQGRDIGHRMALLIIDQSATMEEARTRLVNVIEYTRPEYREDLATGVPMSRCPSVTEETEP